MASSLPPSPSLKHLRNEAKALHKAHQAADAGACETLRFLKRFAKATDEEILAADIPLKEVQFALAMSYGFASWKALKDHVEARGAGAPVDARLLLLEWQSLRQMGWAIRATLSEARFASVRAIGHDAASEANADITDQGKRLVVESETSWASGGLVVELAEPISGTITLEINDPYVPDRLARQTFDLLALSERTEQIVISSRQWEIRHSVLRVTAEPSVVELGESVLGALGSDRLACVAALLHMAQQRKGTPAGAKLLLRAAGACSGGCNHGPLEPDGWERAIGIYRQVMDQYPGTDEAMNARWAHAFCHGVWNAVEGTGVAGCDATNIGKGDWAAAVNLYEGLYLASSDDGSKVAALRRKAELQCTYAGDLAEGLMTYRRIVDEFPGDVTLSPYWSYRTCGMKWGTDGLADDIARLTANGTDSTEEALQAYGHAFAGAPDNRHTRALREAIPPMGPGGAGGMVPKLRTVNACFIQRHDQFVRITSPAMDGSYAKTRQDYEVPFRCTFRLKTDGPTCISGPGGGIVFNIKWDEHEGELAVVDDVAETWTFTENGSLSKDEWHDIVWEVDNEAMRISADGALLFEGPGRYAGQHGGVSVGPAHGSTIDVSGLIVEPI
ncbi:MAG: tetratricopeptide repeat protein [Planctomycetota bacterium]|jgi:hypothetical protein